MLFAKQLIDYYNYWFEWLILSIGCLADFEHAVKSNLLKKVNCS